jgi:four helix bundle protein
LEIAIGSTYELETQLTIAESVRLISKEKINPLLELVTEEQKMLNSFILSVRGRNMKSSITQNLKPD